MHQYEYKGLSKAGYYLLYCPICGRSIALKFDPYDKQVFVEGDNYSSHAFSIGGVTVGEVSTAPSMPCLEPFKRWANEHLHGEA